jgi:putative ABC transport system permease protein
VSILNRKLVRELRDSWGMLLAIVSIIAVGVACFVAMGSSYGNLQRSKQDYYDQCRMPDFWIDLKKAPLAEIEALGSVPGVAAIRPRIRFAATISLPDVTKPLNAMVLSMPDRREPVLADIVLRQGGYFTDRRENEVIVNDAFARHHNLAPGDWIHLVLNNRREELFIVGTAIASEFAYLLGPGAIVPDPEHFGVFYLKRTYAEGVFDFDGAANEVIGRLAGTNEAERAVHEARVLQHAERLLQPYGVIATTPLAEQVSNQYLAQEIEGLRIFALFMPAVFLAVAALVLNVLLSRLADQQRMVVGTLKALGYSNAQVFVHFLKFGTTVGVIGGLTGCAAGYWLADAMTEIYREFFEFPNLVSHFFVGLHGTGLAISIACAVVGSLRGTRAVLRLEPAAAMRPKPPRQGGAVLLERLGWLWTRLSSGWRIVVRSTVRSHTRTAAGVFAAAMGSAVLVSGFMMAKATDYLVDFQFRWIQRSDVDLVFKDERDADALDEARRLPAVDAAEPVLNAAGTFYHGHREKKGGITGLLPGARLTVPRDRQARAVRIPAAGLAMSRTLADILDVQPGQSVTFRPAKGLRRERQVPVVEIADSYMGTAVYADIHYLSRLIGEEFAISGVQLAVDPRPMQVDALYRELRELPALQGIHSRHDLIAKIQETVIEHMAVFIGFLVLFAGVVFFGSILNASLVSLAERQRELATLRVLGYGPWQIGSLMLRESLIVTLAGTLLGMPLGYLLTVLMALAYESEMFRFPVVSGPDVYLATLVLGLVFTLLAHLFVQRSIHQTDWLEALQAKE